MFIVEKLEQQHENMDYKIEVKKMVDSIDNEYWLRATFVFLKTLLGR